MSAQRSVQKQKPSELEEGEIAEELEQSMEEDKNKEKVKLDLPTNLSTLNSLLANDEEEDSSEEGFFLNSKKKLTKGQKTVLNKKRKAPKEKKNKPITTKNKTVCQFYVNGACKRGENCVFSHDVKVKRNKEEICKFLLSGSCTKGDACLYSHDTKNHPCKFFHALGVCDKKEKCKFSHKRLEKEEQIFKFIEENLTFIKEIYESFGKTNLDEYYFRYLSKQKGANSAYTTLPNNMTPSHSIGAQILPVFLPPGTQLGSTSYTPCIVQLPVVPFQLNPSSQFQPNPFQRPDERLLKSFKPPAVQEETPKDPRLNKFKR